MQLVILAGGKGTRLKSRLGDKPKPLVELAGASLLGHLLFLAKRCGVNDVLLLLGYGAKHIRDYCLDGQKWNLNIKYVEEKEPMGTAGALLNAMDLLEDQFIVMYGDTMQDVDLAYFWRYHRQNNAEATLFLHPNDHPQDSDLVEIDKQGSIQAFHSSPHPRDKFLPNLVNAALYVLNKKSLKNICYKEGILDFGKDVFPGMLKKKQKLMGYVSVEYIKDIGTPERLAAVEEDFYHGKIASRCRKRVKKAIFLDRDGVINKEVNRVNSLDELELLPEAATALRKINQSEYLAIIITNQPGIARGDISEDDLEKIHRKLATLLGNQGAYFDSLYYCPHHPDSGFVGERKEYKIICDCRKPNIGLFKKAQKTFDIDLQHSWFIGDTTVDLEAARRAKIHPVLVKTGHGGQDQKFKIRPDIYSENILTAVEKILQRNSK